MTLRKPGKKSYRVGVRKRGVPVQVYFSEREHAELTRIASKRDQSVSALIRAWIRRATAATRAHAAAKRGNAASDPRQLTLA